MLITIDATQVAHEFAIADVCKHSFMTLYSLNPAQVRRVIDMDKDEPVKKEPKYNSYHGTKTTDDKKMWEHLRKLYREKYDYYFETLTNYAHENVPATTSTGIVCSADCRAGAKAPCSASCTSKE